MVRSASRLYDELSEDDRFRKILTDDRIRKDVDHMLEAMQDAGKRVVRPRRNWGRMILITGLAGGATVIALYRPARERVVSAVNAAQLEGERDGPRQQRQGRRDGRQGGGGDGLDAQSSRLRGGRSGDGAGQLAARPRRRPRSLLRGRRQGCP